MKKLILVLSICLVIAVFAALGLRPADSFQVIGAGISSSSSSSSSSSGSFSGQEDFEGTGEPATLWSHYTPANCTVNFDYTTTALESAQSMYVYYTAGDDCWALVTFAEDNDHAYIMLRVPTLPAASQTPLYFFNSANTVLFKMALTSAGGMIPQWSNSDDNGSFSGAAATTYHVWIDHTPGTGANETVAFYFATTATKPGSPTITLSGGPGTTSLRKIQFGAYGTFGVIYDYVTWDGTAIGSNP